MVNARLYKCLNLNNKATDCPFAPGNPHPFLYLELIQSPRVAHRTELQVATASAFVVFVTMLGLGVN